MADALELHEGEVVEKEFKSDYWEKTLLISEPRTEEPGCRR